jgi:hypothetical protein
MTALPKRSTQLEQVKCAVRCPETDEVVGYLLMGEGTGELEQALTENGFWLTPVTSRPVRPAPAPVAA